MPEVNARRRYSSPLRDRQTETTRRVVLEAARELFTAQGYGATTIDEIAQRAGVSKPTVFHVVGNKQTLLRTVRDVAIAGDDTPVPVAKRPMAARILHAVDQGAAVDLLARHLTDVASRYAEIYEVIHAAATSGDDGLRDLWETEERERLAGARHWVETLATKGPLRRGLDADTAVDLLWLLMAPDNFHRLVHRRGWTTNKYRRWLSASVTTMLLPDKGSRPAGAIRSGTRASAGVARPGRSGAQDP